MSTVITPKITFRRARVEKFFICELLYNVFYTFSHLAQRPLYKLIAYLDRNTPNCIASPPHPLIATDGTRLQALYILRSPIATI